jgi:hypothetical protein
MAEQLFDLAKAIEDSKAATKSDLVGAVLLGSSGSGKSRACGTLGVKTLYLYFMGEKHGPASAASAPGSDIIPVCLDHANGQDLDPDATYQRILDILGGAEAIKKLGVGAIVLDSASELEACIRSSTAWKDKCRTKKDEHNSFAEGPATVSLFRPVLRSLDRLQKRLRVHFVVTCILDIKSLQADDEIIEATPKLTGFDVAVPIVQQFGDIIVVGPRERAGVVKYKFQMKASLTKESKDLQKNVTRTITFRPRLTGVDNVPDSLDADLSAIIALKAKGTK